MRNVTWVHLSDWHQRGVDFDRGVVRDALVRDLRDRARNISASLTRIDFVMFSGDLAFSGKAEEYRVARQEFIEPILKACGLVDGERVKFERFFLVPGNHDVDRDLTSLLRTDVRFFENRARLIGTLTNEHSRAIALGPMQAYARFVRETFVREDSEKHGGGRCSDYGFHCWFEVGEVSVCIIGLNSSWLCGTNRDSGGEVDDYGNIIVGEMQVEQALRDAKKADLVIGVLHHPFQWLSLKNGVDDRVKVRNRLMNECHLILHGHEHEPAVSAYSSTHGSCVIIPCGSAYDRRDPGAAMYANGYNLCTVNMQDRQAKAYLRRFDGDRSWLPEFRISRPNADGSFEFTVPVKLEEDGPLVAKTALNSRSGVPRTSLPVRHQSDVPILVTSKQPDSVPTVASDVLRQERGGIAVNVYVGPFGTGIRHLVNNRYIIAHAVSANTPYSNVVAFLRGPQRFTGPEITEPVWKVWLRNEGDVSKTLTLDDTETIRVGWHNFVLRWDHAKPLLEVLLDGHVMIADAAYVDAWPTRFTTDVSLGAWPRHSPDHYVETCIAGWRVLENPFDDALIDALVKTAISLPDCTQS